MLERADQGVGRILAVPRQPRPATEHDRDLHQRQRRRMAVAQRAALPPQGDGVGRRHPRAGDHSAGRGAFRAGGVSGQVGITMDLTASILAATGTPVPPRHASKGSTCSPCSKDARRRSSGRCSGVSCGARPQQAVRSGDWKLLFDGGRPMLFNLRTDIGERNNVIGERSDIARRLRPLLAAWQDRRRCRGETGAGTLSVEE